MINTLLLRCWRFSVGFASGNVFSGSVPSEKDVYIKEVLEASLERLAHLIKVCGFLMQTKVYLFWTKGKTWETFRQTVSNLEFHCDA